MVNRQNPKWYDSELSFTLKHFNFWNLCRFGSWLPNYKFHYSSVWCRQVVVGKEPGSSSCAKWTSQKIAIRHTFDRIAIFSRDDPFYNTKPHQPHSHSDCDWLTGCLSETTQSSPLHSNTLLLKWMITGMTLLLLLSGATFIPTAACLPHRSASGAAVRIFYILYCATTTQHHQPTIDQF